MKPVALIPDNALENALQNAQRGQIATSDFFRVFMKESVFFPSRAEVQQDGSGWSPIIYDREGVAMVAIFSSQVRVPTTQAKYCLCMTGNALIQRFPPNFGLVLNPGFDVGLEISPQGIPEIRRNFCDTTLS